MVKKFSKILLSGENYFEITEESKNYKQVYNIMEELKIASGMRYMPQIYVIKADYLNAFASGWTKDNTMVAVTSALVEKLNRDELAAVLAHELSHIRNEDIKLTLLIGVTTNVMLFVVNNIVFFMGRGNGNGVNKAKIILYILQFVLPLITIVLQMYLSRTREFMADSGAVELTRNSDAMISALQKISVNAEPKKNPNINNSKNIAFFHMPKGLFSTHPSIEDRIKSLSN